MTGADGTGGCLVFPLASQHRTSALPVSLARAQRGRTSPWAEEVGGGRRIALRPRHVLMTDSCHLGVVRTE